MGRCQIRFAGICLHAAEWGHHIVPQRNGGPDSAENLILACWPCNVRVEEIGKIDATATGLFAESVDDLPAAADARARYLRGYTRGGRPWETGAPDQSKPEPYW